MTLTSEIPSFTLRVYRTVNDTCVSAEFQDLDANTAVILRDTLQAEGWQVYHRVEFTILSDELDAAATKEAE